MRAPKVLLSLYVLGLASCHRLVTPDTERMSSVLITGTSTGIGCVTAVTLASRGMHKCLDQYNANKATNTNGGLKWIMKGGGYYSECNKRLKS